MAIITYHWLHLTTFAIIITMMTGNVFVRSAHNAIITLEEVADILRVSVSTVRRMIEDGELKAGRVRGQWRVLKEDLEEYIRNPQS